MDFLERRKPMPIKLDEEQSKMLSEIHVILTDPNVGLCKTVKKHGEAIYGNGRIGIKTQILILWLLTAVLGMESPLVAKAVKLFVK